MDAAADGRSHRHRRAGHPASGPVVGHGQDQLPHACPRHRAPQPRRAERTWGPSISYWPPGESGAQLAVTPRSPARATARADESMARNATSCREPAISKTRNIAPMSPKCGASPSRILPHKGVDCYEIFRKVDSGEIRGLLSISINPMVSLPDSGFVKRMLEKLEFYVTIDFFMSETAALPTSYCPVRSTRKTKASPAVPKGGVIKINKAIEPPGDAKQDWKIIQDIAAIPGPRAGLHFCTVRPEIFEELRARSGRAAWPTTPALLMTRSSETWASSGPARPRDPTAGPSIMPGRRGCSNRDRGTRRTRQRARFYFPDGKARFNVDLLTRRPRKKLMRNTRFMLTTGRVVSQFLSGCQTRRIGPLEDQYPEPRFELHPHAAESLGHRRRRLGQRSNRGAGAITIRAQVVATIRPGHGLRALPLGRRQEHQPRDDRCARSDFENPRVQGLRGPRREGVTEPQYANTLEPQQ